MLFGLFGLFRRLASGTPGGGNTVHRLSGLRSVPSFVCVATPPEGATCRALTATAQLGWHRRGRLRTASRTASTGEKVVHVQIALPRSPPGGRGGHLPATSYQLPVPLILLILLADFTYTAGPERAYIGK